MRKALKVNVSNAWLTYYIPVDYNIYNINTLIVLSPIKSNI